MMSSEKNSYSKRCFHSVHQNLLGKENGKKQSHGGQFCQHLKQYGFHVRVTTIRTQPCSEKLEEQTLFGITVLVHSGEMMNKTDNSGVFGWFGWHRKIDE